jgi:hypothetical protein
MGFNYAAADYSSAVEMVKAHIRSESEHLNAFVHFVSSNKRMKRALEKKDWAAFASAYNGAGYRKNDYDSKMAQAYERLTNAVAGPGNKHA